LGLAGTLELLAMGAVVGPVTGGRNPLTGGNHGGVANDRNEIAVAARLDPNHAKPVVGILVGDALDQPGEHFPIRWLRLRLHDGHRSVPVVKTLAPGAIKQLGDQELDQLQVAVIAEQKRRGGKPAASIQIPVEPQTEPAAVHLTTGKLNSVPAAFKVGVKPS
jgi:hypothetical protein